MFYDPNYVDNGTPGTTSTTAWWPDRTIMFRVTQSLGFYQPEVRGSMWRMRARRSGRPGFRLPRAGRSRRTFLDGSLYGKATDGETRGLMDRSDLEFGAPASSAAKAAGWERPLRC